LLTSFRLLTPISLLAAIIEPRKGRRLVPKAPHIQPALSRNHLHILVGQAEISGIAHQSDLAWHRRRQLLEALHESVRNNLKNRLRRTNQDQDARTPMVRIIANHGVKKSTRFFYRFSFE
jgi:hypothetical protein